MTQSRPELNPLVFTNGSKQTTQKTVRSAKVVVSFVKMALLFDWAVMTQSHLDLNSLVFTNESKQTNQTTVQSAKVVVSFVKMALRERELIGNHTTRPPQGCIIMTRTTLYSCHMLAQARATRTN